MTQRQASRQATPDFPVEWAEPGDEKLTWVRESVHHPYPHTSLSISYGQRVTAEYGFRQFSAWMRGFPAASQVRTIYPQGFIYRPEARPAEEDVSLREYRRQVEETAPRLWDFWKRDLEPEIIATFQQLKNGDYVSMSVLELASYLEVCMNKAAGANGRTFVAASPMFASLRPLSDICRQEFDEEGEEIAAVLTQGFANESSASDIGLWQLATLADSLPKVAQLFGERTAEELPARLSHVEGGSSWLESFSKFIDQYGWRTDTWDELSMPTWRDSPTPALRVIQRYLEGGREADPRTSLARSARRRRAMTRRVESTLAAQPEKLARFRAALKMSRRYVTVREKRAYWQLTLPGTLRPLCLALGDKLCRMGVLEQAEDVFYLRLEETQEIARGSRDTDWLEVVNRRRAERIMWMDAEPPPFLGAEPDANAGIQSPPAVQEAGEEVLRGMPASIGVAQGPASVVRTLEEADKVQKGDILVCRTSSPSWTYLFSRVAAVVAESGSALSHSAIVAREYGIPCVVGATNATSLIKDGMSITVDGGKGTVLLEN